MFRKWTCLLMGPATILAVAFSTFSLEARAAGQPLARSGDQNYNSSAAYGNGFYDTTTVSGMFHARYASGDSFRTRNGARTAAPARISDYGPHARELASRRNRADIAAGRHPVTAPRSPRDWTGNPDRWLWNMDEPDARSLGGAPQNSSAATPLPQPSFPPAQPDGAGFGGTNRAVFDGGGALRGAGAPTNVDSPTEGFNGRFRDEADAQSSKPPQHPGSPNPNR